MQNWIGDRGGIRFVRLKDEEKSLVVSCGKCCEGGYFLERLVIFYVSQL